MTETATKLTAAEYHADHSRVSNSMLSVFRQSRRKYFQRFVEQSMPSPEPTAAMRLGSLVHLLLLESEAAARLIVAPKVDRRTKEGKADWAQFLEASAGMEIVDAEDLAEAKAIRDAVLSNPVARGLLEREGENEVTHYWTEPHTGIACKCRYDRKCLDVIPDLKTSHDSSPRAFADKATSLGYHRQAAWYRSGWKIASGETLPFVFIVVCTEAPYDVGIYELDDDALKLGEQQNESAIRNLASCLKTGDWREKWQRQITQLSLPKWAIYQEEYEIL